MANDKAIAFQVTQGPGQHTLRNSVEPSCELSVAQSAGHAKTMDHLLPAYASTSRLSPSSSSLLSLQAACERAITASKSKSTGGITRVPSSVSRPCVSFAITIIRSACCKKKTPFRHYPCHRRGGIRTRCYQRLVAAEPRKRPIDRRSSPFTRQRSRGTGCPAIRGQRTSDRSRRSCGGNGGRTRRHFCRLRDVYLLHRVRRRSRYAAQNHLGGPASWHKRYVPWQFGVDYDVVGRGSGQKVFDEQSDVRDMLRRQTATQWVIVSTGMFTSFLFEPAFGVVDLEHGKVHALGSWHNRLTITTSDNIGRLTAVASRMNRTPRTRSSVSRGIRSPTLGLPTWWSSTLAGAWTG